MANLDAAIWGLMLAWLTGPGLRIALIAVLALVVYRLAKRAIPKMMKEAVSKSLPGWPQEEVIKRADTLAQVISKTAALVVLVGAIFTILSELDINIAPVLAGVGVAGVAIGFGAQSLVRDVLNGLLIILENQFGKGDVVKTAGVSGLVEEVNLRRTILRDMDGTVHSIPNGEIRVVSNLTREWSRVNLNISVGYGEDLDHVIAVVNRVGQDLAQDPQWAPLILKPPQALRVDNLGESGVEIKILGDTKPIRQWEVAGELRKRLKQAFDEEGIETRPYSYIYLGPLHSPASSSEKGLPKEA